MNFENKIARVGAFRITESCGDAGAKIRFNIAEDHALAEHPNIMLFIDGAFSRVQVGALDGDAPVDYAPGDTNDKIGALRKKGLYEMTAIANGSRWICVSAPGVRPSHETRTEPFDLMPGELFIVVDGAQRGEVIYADKVQVPIVRERFTRGELFWV